MFDIVLNTASNIAAKYLLKECNGMKCLMTRPNIYVSTAAFSVFTAQKMKFSIKDFFSKCNQIRRKLKKSLTENSIFCAMFILKGEDIFFIRAIIHFMGSVIVKNKC